MLPKLSSDACPSVVVLAEAEKYLRNSVKVSGYGTKSASKTEMNSVRGSQHLSASRSAPPLKPCLDVLCMCLTTTPGLTSAVVRVYPSPFTDFTELLIDLLDNRRLLSLFHLYCHHRGLLHNYLDNQS